MQIRQALIPEEHAAIAALLDASGLSAPVNVGETLYAEAQGRIIATVSRTGELVSHLAVDPGFRGEAVAETLVGALLSRMNAEGIHRRLVFTKSAYVPLFESMHFTKVADSGVVAILENGTPDLETELTLIRALVERTFGVPIAKLDLGATVVNCNPMTLGHQGLIRYAASRHQGFLVFVLEEDASTFSYEERIAMVRLGTREIENVLVVPSTKYVVSNLTFPSYFLKMMSSRDREHATLDAVIFRDRFMPALNIVCRYIGTEFDPMMQTYNALLKETLGDRLFELVRYASDGAPISASRVRKLLMENKTEEALALVPVSNRGLLRAIWEERHGQPR
ncbi:MAG: hypothetical protein Q8N15_07870 [Bacillota bacterium]|nr:hypothetical protein [Bacillota bacterium]